MHACLPSHAAGGLCTSCAQVTQHAACRIRVTVDNPASREVTPTTALTAVMVDSAGAADIDRKGNIGQWDMWH